MVEAPARDPKVLEALKIKTKKIALLSIKPEDE